MSVFISKNFIYNPSVISGATFYSLAYHKPMNKWNQETYQLNNEVRIDGLPTGLIPNFSGADVTTERVTLDSTIILDCTVGWRVKFKVLSNGAWESGTNTGFGFLGGDSQNGGFYSTTTNNIIAIHDGTNFVTLLGWNLDTYMLEEIEFRCDAINIYGYRNGVLVDTKTIGSLATIQIDLLGFSRGREAQGLLYDIYINSLENSDAWTNYYSGINGDWSDQIEKETLTTPELSGIAETDSEIRLFFDSNGKTQVFISIDEVNYTYVGISELNDTEYLINNLITGTIYHIRVRAIRDGFVSSWSNAVSFELSAWLLAGGVWDDGGKWYDGEIWED